MSLSPISNYASGAAATAAPVPPASVAKSAAPVAPAAPTDVAASSAVPVALAADRAKLDRAVESINKFLKPVNSGVEFSIDEDSGRTVVQVIDTDTRDVLRQYPTKQALEISHDLAKLQGLLLQDKA